MADARRPFGAIALLLLLLSVLPAQGIGQFRLILDPPDASAFPLIRIPLKVIDNSAVIEALSASDFSLTERGAARAPLMLDCPTRDTSKLVRVMFILDVSTSMDFIEGTRIYDNDSLKWRKAKQMMHYAFRQLRPADLGGLITFSALIGLEENFTPDKKLIDDAEEGLGLHSGTAIHDAVLFALPLCSADSANSKTIIILLTDGSDQSSKASLADAIIDARARRIPVYTIGLGVEPVDQSALDSLAHLTGGEFLPAATTEQLKGVFDSIFKSIYSTNCILSYVTPDTCRLGYDRPISVTVTINGRSDTQPALLRDPDLRSTLTVYPVPPDTVQDDQDLFVPFVVSGEVRAGEPLVFGMRVDYDTTLLRYIDIGGATTVLDPAELLVTGNPGSLTIRAAGAAAVPRRGVAPPPKSGDTLCVLRFRVAYRTTNARSTLRLTREGEWSQHCVMRVSDRNTGFVINGCPELQRFTIDTALVLRPAQETPIPIRMLDSVDVQQPMQFSMDFQYDASLLSYRGFSTVGTICEGAPVTVVELSAGYLRIACAETMPTKAGGVLLWLRFHSGNQKQASRVSLSADQISFFQSCAPRVEFDGDHIFIDGWCERLTMRKPVLKMTSLYPNPVAAGASAEVSVEFEVQGNGRARIELANMNGEVRRVLFDGHFAEGTHAVTFSVGDLPGGSYLCTLREGFTISTKLLIVTR
jgi:hypothetical protein